VIQALTVVAIWVVMRFFYPDSSMVGFGPSLIVIGVVWVLGLCGGIVGAAIVARRIARPIEQFVAATQRMESGEALAPPPDEKELVQLGALGALAITIRERERRLREAAARDPLTGLLNREALIAVMGEQLGELHSAVMVVGLTRLQETLRTVGREIADRMVVEAGSRLRMVVGAAPLARVGDDTFAAWINKLDSKDALDLANRIVQAFDRPYQETYLALDVSAAVGIALYPEHGDQASLLLQHADVALLTGRRMPDHTAVYNPATDPRRPEHLSLMVDLRQALDRNELELYYQPKLDLKNNRISGVEALVRWHHEHRGNVGPDLFIGLAEETGNIPRLTRWALTTGIAQAARWLNRGLAIRVSVNVSVYDLADADLATRISRLLIAHDVPPEYLMLEVTESAIMGEPDSAIGVLQRIADLGIQLSIDDFGVGYSSLAYLSRLPVSELKIDKSFVQTLAVSSENQKIVQSVIEMGHRLGYTVIAEGVEDADALMGLKVLGCDYAQGYYISKPLSRNAMEQFFTDAPWPTRRLATAS